MPTDSLVEIDDQLVLAAVLLEAAVKTPFVTVFFLNLRDHGTCEECLGNRKPESLIQRVALGESDGTTTAMVVSYICRRCART